jgi:hypothetical protein
VLDGIGAVSRDDISDPGRRAKLLVPGAGVHRETQGGLAQLFAS